MGESPAEKRWLRVLAGGGVVLLAFLTWRAVDPHTRRVRADEAEIRRTHGEPAPDGTYEMTEEKGTLADLCRKHGVKISGISKVTATSKRLTMEERRELLRELLREARERNPSAAVPGPIGRMPLCHVTFGPGASVVDLEDMAAEKGCLYEIGYGGGFKPALGTKDSGEVVKSHFFSTPGILGDILGMPGPKVPPSGKYLMSHSTRGDESNGSITLNFQMDDPERWVGDLVRVVESQERWEGRSPPEGYLYMWSDNTYELSIKVTGNQVTVCRWGRD